MNIALIGDKDSIALFNLVGINRCYDNHEMFKEIVTDKDLAVLLITDKYAEKLKNKIIQHRLMKDLPIIIEIPGKKKMEREDSIKRLIMRAVGVEVK